MYGYSSPVSIRRLPFPLMPQVDLDVKDVSVCILQTIIALAAVEH